jgi:hypothetical protein
MRRLIGWSALLFICFACSSNSSDGTDTGDQASDSGGDIASDSGNGTNDTANNGTDTGGDLWASAWSILGTSCGSANSCHNRASGGSAGINLPADDEAQAKTNAEAKKSSIRSEISSGGMPQGSTLTQEERQMVTDWIDSL